MLNRLQTYAVKVLGIALICGGGVVLSSQISFAAENVVLKYGFFSRSIPVDALTNYTDSGQVSGGIAALLKSVSDDDRSAVLKLLDARLPFGVLQVDQILKSPIGAQFLNDLAAATELPGDSEVKALRSAALVSAAEDKSLSFGAMLKRYPTQDLTVNIPLLLKTFKESPAIGQILKGGLQNVSPPPTNRP